MCVYQQCAGFAPLQNSGSNCLIPWFAPAILNNCMRERVMIRAQDFILKPAILALILSVVSSLVLICRPSVRRRGPGGVGCVNPWKSRMDNFRETGDDHGIVGIHYRKPCQETSSASFFSGIFPLKSDKSVKGFGSSQKVLYNLATLFAVNSSDFQEATIDIRWPRFED